MNKENEEEMLSFDGDPFQFFFSPICTFCVHLKGHGSCEAFLVILLSLLKFGLEKDPI